MIEKICKNCGWSVYRAGSADDEMIDDKGISKEFLCRKLNLKVYGNDRSCPNFVLADQHYQK
ncbi:hypothetical protein [Candidatus Lokiarchaeum ossiferum]|uniref:hypothetical protein n=1 Tax=Candidatus Lokiarchaeum ossiferum TaxID=2951803 RepID=UPI00352F6E94